MEDVVVLQELGHVPADFTIISLDLESMFTNVPVNEAIELVRTRLTIDAEGLKQTTPIKPDDIVRLLYLLHDVSYFRFDDKFFHQLRGLAMGGSTSSPLAEEFMSNFETLTLPQFPGPPEDVLFWFRSADDSLTAVRTSRVDEFHNFMNSRHPSIKWTIEREEGGAIPMLDVLIQRTPGGALEFDVYRKKTHTNQYISWDSNAPLQHKLSTVRSLTRRAMLIPSSATAREIELNRIRDALSLNGYPRWAYEKGRYREREQDSGATSHANDGAANTISGATNINGGATGGAKAKPKGNVTLPYHQGTTEPLARVLRKAGISTSITARGTLREKLVRSKDKLAREDIPGVVYHVPCAGRDGQHCPAAYVGETGRKLDERFREHTSTAQAPGGGFKSPVIQHAADTGHHFRLEDVSVIQKDSRGVSRRIREAMAIRALDPSLNANVGRIELPPSYDAILKQLFQRPDPPTPHSPLKPLLSTVPRGQGRPRNYASVNAAINAGHIATRAPHPPPQPSLDDSWEEAIARIDAVFRTAAAAAATPAAATQEPAESQTISKTVATPPTARTPETRPKTTSTGPQTRSKTTSTGPQTRSKTRAAGPDQSL